MEEQPKDVQLKNRTKNPLQNQRGNMLVGALIALVIIAGGLVAVVGMGRSATVTSNSNEEKSNLTVIRGKIQEKFAGQPDYSQLTTTIAKQGKVFPPKMLKGPNVKNLWGGDVTTLPNGGDPTRFDIQYTAVPEEVCTDLALIDYGGWSAVDVNGTAIPQAGGGMTAAAGACGASNTLTWTAF